MEIKRKIPLYLGLGVFIITILFVSIKLGEKNFILNKYSQAAVDSTLFLNYLKPNQVEVNVLSNKPVGGIDVVLKFDSNKINILSSTLRSGIDFTTTGGVVNSNYGTFSFSVLPTGNEITKGILATFEVQPVNSSVSNIVGLEFLEGPGETLVLENQTGQTIGVKTQGVNFKLN